MSLEQKHEEPRSLLSDTTVEVLEPVPGKVDVGLGLGLVGPTEWRDAGQQDVRDDADAPNVGLWRDVLLGHDFWSWDNRNTLKHERIRKWSKGTLDVRRLWTQG